MEKEMTNAQLLELIKNNFAEDKIVFMTIDGIHSVDAFDFIKQPTLSILYDLNRDTATLTTMAEKSKNVRFVNDFAAANTIDVLKKALDNAWEELEDAKSDSEKNEKLLNENVNLTSQNTNLVNEISDLKTVIDSLKSEKKTLQEKLNTVNEKQISDTVVDKLNAEYVQLLTAKIKAEEESKDLKLENQRLLMELRKNTGINSGVISNVEKPVIEEDDEDAEEFVHTEKPATDKQSFEEAAFKYSNRDNGYVKHDPNKFTEGIINTGLEINL